MRLKVLAHILAILGVVTLAGCVPMRPNVAPLQVAVIDGEVGFRWCGSTTASMGALSISFRVQDDANEYVRAFAGTGDFTLEQGAVVSVSSPPAGVTVEESAPFVVSDDPTYIFFDTGESLRNLNGVEAIFYVRSLARLEAGEWLTTTGSVVSGDCTAAPE